MSVIWTPSGTVSATLSDIETYCGGCNETGTVSAALAALKSTNECPACNGQTTCSACTASSSRMPGVIDLDMANWDWTTQPYANSTQGNYPWNTDDVTYQQGFGCSGATIFSSATSVAGYWNTYLNNVIKLKPTAAHTSSTPSDCSRYHFHLCPDVFWTVRVRAPYSMVGMAYWTTAKISLTPSGGDWVLIVKFEYWTVTASWKDPDDYGTTAEFCTAVATEDTAYDEDDFYTEYGAVYGADADLEDVANVTVSYRWEFSPSTSFDCFGTATFDDTDHVDVEESTSGTGAHIINRHGRTVSGEISTSESNPMSNPYGDIPSSKTVDNYLSEIKTSMGCNACA